VHLQLHIGYYIAYECGKGFFRNIWKRLVFMSADEGLAGTETEFGM